MTVERPPRSRWEEPVGSDEARQRRALAQRAAIRRQRSKNAWYVAELALAILVVLLIVILGGCVTVVERPAPGTTIVEPPAAPAPARGS